MLGNKILQKKAKSFCNESYLSQQINNFKIRN